MLPASAEVTLLAAIGVSMVTAQHCRIIRRVAAAAKGRHSTALVAVGGFVARLVALTRKDKRARHAAARA